MAKIDTISPPNEMPGIAGARPANPLAANFKPFIPASARLRELTPVPLIVGTLLGIIFGASSLYLVLKVGLTVSASIPVAVISITLFRIFSKLGLRDATILENNIVQTAGSAGESIAFGLGVTMPAIMILGFDLEITRVMLVATLGGLLGILMMIPLRRALIVDQHGLLKYPEGTACAEVLKVAASREGLENQPNDEAATGGKTIFSGFGIGFIYQSAMNAFNAWKNTPEKIFGAPFKAGSISMTIEPALLGVGYIIGPRIGSIMCAGGVLAYLVLIPAIKFFGEGATGILAPGTMPISQMAPDDIREAYVLYIGAGAVAAGGIISMVRSLPLIWHGIKSGLADLRRTKGSASTTLRGGGRLTEAKANDADKTTVTSSTWRDCNRRIRAASQRRFVNQRRRRDLPLSDLFEMVRRLRQGKPWYQVQLPIDRLRRRHPHALESHRRCRR